MTRPKKHKAICPLYNFSYDLGSGQDIPECKCDPATVAVPVEVVERVADAMSNSEWYMTKKDMTGPVLDELRAALKLLQPYTKGER